MTDEEFWQQYEVAQSVRPWLPIVFEVSYHCAARGVEALDLKLGAVGGKG